MKAPTAQQLWDDELEEVHSTFDDDWRHGGTRYVVYYREEDDTYWSVSYRVSTYGEFHGLREVVTEKYYTSEEMRAKALCLHQVYKKEKVVVVYESE